MKSELIGLVIGLAGYAVCALIYVLTHELGHILAYWHYGIPLANIQLGTGPVWRTLRPRWLSFPIIINRWHTQVAVEVADSHYQRLSWRQQLVVTLAGLAVDALQLVLAVSVGFLTYRTGLPAVSYPLKVAWLVIMLGCVGGLAGAILGNLFVKDGDGRQAWSIIGQRRRLRAGHS
jgi:membrane-associated protease RseP (regulator of RpoE activity)